MEIQDTKQVWVAWTNTDCTEGRGWIIPKAVCEKKATALRLGKKGSVQGSDCDVEEVTVVKVGNRWMVPGNIIAPSKEDLSMQKRIDEKDAAIERAKAAGLSDEDLKIIVGKI
jgi:hypothetical protein